MLKEYVKKRGQEKVPGTLRSSVKSSGILFSGGLSRRWRKTVISFSYALRS